jgi:hypothetical protein
MLRLAQVRYFWRWSTKEESLWTVWFSRPCAEKDSRISLYERPVRKMILRIEGDPTIDNLQNYPAEVVDQLRKLFVEGVSARQDPRRKNFYDVEHADRAFFLHHSPLTGKVILLSVWRLLVSPFASLDDVTVG